MLYNMLTNLFFTIHSALYCWLGKIPGWRYPTITYLDEGYQLPHTERIAEVIAFNLLKHHPIMRCWQRYKTPLVALVSYHPDHLRVSLFKLVEDTGQADLAIPTCGYPGKEGRFHYLIQEGQLRHALRPTQLTRKTGFFDNEPVMCLHIPFTDENAREIHDLYHVNGILLPAPIESTEDVVHAAENH